MTVLGKHTYRLAFAFGEDRNTWEGACSFDLLKFPSGVSLKFEIGVYEETVDGDFWDMSDVANLRCEVRKMAPGKKRPNPQDPTYMQSDPIPPDAATITATGWENSTDQHATFNFEPSETALDPGAYWLTFSGFLTGGDFVSFGWGEIEVVQDGTGVVSTVAPLDPSYYTAAQIEAMLSADGLLAVYDTDTYVEQSDASYEYYAWARIDGAGYKAERWSLATGSSAGVATGALPIPADLTTINFN